MFPQTSRVASAHALWRLNVVVALFFAFVLDAPKAHAAARRVPPRDLTKEDLPELLPPRDGIALVAAKGALYAIGGDAGGKTLGVIERFDPKVGRWERVAEVLPRRHAAAVVVDDTILIFGGRDERGPLAEVEAFDLKTHRVTLRQPMPTPRYFASAALYHGRVYVAGGTLGWGRLPVVEVYDPARDTWYVAPRLSTPRDTQLVVVNGALYGLGGFLGHEEGVSAKVERLEGRRWVEVSTLPRPTSAYAVAVLDDEVYLFGDHRDLGRVLRFDPATGEGRDVSADFFPRRLAAAAVLDGAIYVVGGSQPSESGVLRLGTIERFRKARAAR